MRHLLGRAIPLALVDISEDTESAGARRYPGRNVRYVKGPAPAVGDMMDSELALFGPWRPGLWPQNWTGRNVYYDTHLRQGKTGNCVSNTHPHGTNVQYASHRVFIYSMIFRNPR
jgi:hypothetical protein